MDVRCPKCQTLYELDDTQVKAPLVTLKCSQCQYVFRFESRQAVVQENHRRWMVRKRKTGDILYFNALDALHQWIMQGQVTHKDEISRTGKTWMLLGEIGESVPVFQVVESISSLSGQPKPEDSSIAARKISEEHAIPVAPQEPRERVRTEIQFGKVEAPEEVTQRARPSRMTPNSLPAPLPPNPRVRRDERFVTPNPPTEKWELGGDVPQTHLTSEVTSHTERPHSRAPLFAVIAIVVAGAAYVFFFQRPLLDGIMGQDVPRSAVSLGNTQGDEGQTAGTTQGAVESAQSVEDAIAASEAAQHAAAVAKFEEALQVIHPKMDQALGVATEEAELAAESENDPKEKLAKAKRTLEGGRASQALSIYKDVLDQDGRNVEAITGVAWCYIELGRFNDAASNFRRALEIDPKEGDALIGLGTAERQRGNLRAAFDAYDLYLGRHPKGAKSSIARYQIDALRKQLGL